MKDQRNFKKHLIAGGCMRVVLAVVLAVVFAIDGSPAIAKHDDSGTGGNSKACRKTSQAALSACKSSATSDYWLAIGACENISDREAKKTCQDDARSSKREDLETCSEQFDARQEVCQELGGGPYNPDIAPANFSSTVTNTFFPLPDGRTYTYQSTAPNGDILQTIVVTVVDPTTINGFPCKAVTDKVYQGTDTTSANRILLEDTIDWFSQDITPGNVWYFGETTIAYTYDDAGNPTASTEGSWMAGTDNAKPGIIMQADPQGQIGKLYRQEFSLGTAEDVATIVEILTKDEFQAQVLGGNTAPAVFGAGPFLHTQDSSPLEPGVIEDKYYASGVGLVLTTNPDGTREELISITP